MIAFVYFDLGGVVIKDFSQSNKWQEMKLDMGVTPEKETAFEQFWANHKDSICIDQDIDDLIPLLRSQLDLNIKEGYSWLNDFVDRFEPNFSIWLVIQKIHKYRPIGLLTDMYPRMFDMIQASGLLPPVKWDVIIDSSIEHCKKPYQEIFDLAVQRSHTPIKEILFTDNMEKNTEAAKSFGWQTFLYDSSNYEQSSYELEKYMENQ